jgi:hypothetical protein
VKAQEETIKLLKAVVAYDELVREMGMKTTQAKN